MRGREFLDVVDILTATDTEASVRSQVGRIYYAAYLESRSWCEANLGFQRRRFASEHADVQRMMVSIDPDIADNLAFLRAYRNTADYDLDISFETLRGQLADALVRTSNTIARLDTLASEVGETGDQLPDPDPEPDGPDEPSPEIPSESG